MSDSDDSKPKPGGSVPGAGSASRMDSVQRAGQAQPSADPLSALESPDLEKPRTSTGSDKSMKGAAADGAGKSGNTIRAAAPEARRKGGAAWSLVIVLLLLVALGAAYIAWPFWAPTLPDRMRAMIAPVMEMGRDASGKAGDGALAALEGRVAGLEKALAATRTTLDVARTENAANLAREIGKVDTKITAVSGDAAPLAKRLGEIEQRLAALAAESRTDSGGRTTIRRERPVPASAFIRRRMDGRSRYCISWGCCSCRRSTIRLPAPRGRC